MISLKTHHFRVRKKKVRKKARILSKKGAIFTLFQTHAKEERYISYISYLDIIPEVLVKTPRYKPPIQFFFSFYSLSKKKSQKSNFITPPSLLLPL